MSEYLPTAGGIFSGVSGGVLGNADQQFLEAAGMGATGASTAAFRRIAENAAMLRARQAAAADPAAAITTGLAPVQADLLGGAKQYLMPAAAAVGAYFLLPDKYKILGALVAGGGVWYATKPATV